MVVNTGLNFSSTGSWANWSISSATANLIGGVNKIRLTTIGSNEPNVDKLSLGIPGLIQPAQSFIAGKEMPSASANVLTAIVSPNLVTGNAKLIVSTSADLPIDLQVFDLLGRKHKSLRLSLRGSNV